ncbi:MAG: OmpA family protein, partial [Vicinamibacteria bacterium]|nr:OmpA family protein [Vicinamibacteria bacterium]
LGTGKMSFRGDLILSKHFNKKADIHAALGYQINQDPDTIDIGNALKWGVGLNLPACNKLQLQAEVVGTQYSGASIDQTNPIDLVVGPALWLKPGFFIRPAISKNLTFDDRGLGSSAKSSMGKQITIGYTPGTPCCEVYIPPPPPPPAVNKAPTAACEIEKSQILPGETVRARAVASDPDGDALTYQWTASDGRVVGGGAEVTFDSTGVVGPATVTITVNVSDGRGGSAKSNCQVRIEEPKRAPEPVSCTSGGFPRNLARLNNMDKACLDDVASRVKQDPRGRVVIIGHADKGERYPEVIGRKRADAVKGYLVKERGIEEARITVKSAGAAKPVDPGKTVAARAKNRRVEIFYVPEGATLPEDDD